MAEYIDGFVFPLARRHLETYRDIAAQVADIWKAHGALAYQEFVGDDLYLEGTRSFPETLKVNDDESVVFGWVVFPSKEIRDAANRAVPQDPRMAGLIAPLLHPDAQIFAPAHMVYGGFRKLSE